MTVREAARLGGLTTRERHGSEHFRRVGAKGGERVRQLIREGQRLEREERECPKSES